MSSFFQNLFRSTHPTPGFVFWSAKKTGGKPWSCCWGATWGRHAVPQVVPPSVPFGKTWRVSAKPQVGRKICFQHVLNAKEKSQRSLCTAVDSQTLWFWFGHLDGGDGCCNGWRLMMEEIMHHLGYSPKLVQIVWLPKRADHIREWIPPNHGHNLGEHHGHKG